MLKNSTRKCGITPVSTLHLFLEPQITGSIQKKNTQESNNLRFKFHIVVNVVKSLSFLLFMTYLKHQLKCYNVLYLYKTNFKNFEKNIFIIFLVVFSIYPYLDLESSKKN